MEIRADAGRFFEIETDTLVVAVYEGEKPEGGALAEIDKRTGGVLTSLIETGELTGKAGETAYVHSAGDMKARCILFMGAGKLADLNIGFKDLETSKSSLEDIFVDLVKEGGK